MKSLILPFSFLVKISVLSLLFFVTAAPSIIDNSRASNLSSLQGQENNVAEDKKSRQGAKESSMHQGAMNSVRPQKPGYKKPACSLHDSVHC